MRKTLPQLSESSREEGKEEEGKKKKREKRKEALFVTAVKFTEEKLSVKGSRRFLFSLVSLSCQTGKASLTVLPNLFDIDYLLQERALEYYHIPSQGRGILNRLSQLFALPCSTSPPLFQLAVLFFLPLPCCTYLPIDVYTQAGGLFYSSSLFFLYPSHDFLL